MIILRWILTTKRKNITIFQFMNCVLSIKLTNNSMQLLPFIHYIFTKAKFLKVPNQNMLYIRWLASVTKYYLSEVALISKIHFQLKFFVSAFSIRLFSVLRYESMIHEFDPYFNYRTTKFLADEGFYNFHNW